ncbi:hypothetical protein AB0F42_33270 [Streptomyces buecherae]|uniref:hypothetical protein n=1 Tax=Streptomyces buecherae TaxID=2763006 RepID=UPI0033CB8A89
MATARTKELLDPAHIGLIATADAYVGSVSNAAINRFGTVLNGPVTFPFADIARITGRTPAACRELASTARRRVRDSLPLRPRRPTRRASSGTSSGVGRAGHQRARRPPCPGATFTVDGGGVVAAAPQPIQGSEGIARYLTGLVTQAPGGLTLSERAVNHRAGLLIAYAGVTVAVYAFNIADGHITHAWAMRNPDKLHPWTTGSTAAPYAP